jgi:hypothetical protein
MNDPKPGDLPHEQSKVSQIDYSNLSPQDLLLIERIVERVKDLAEEYKLPVEPWILVIDVATAHTNGRPLKLQQLLMTSNEDLIHDVLAIGRHIDRKTGKLPDFLRLRNEVTRH